MPAALPLYVTAFRGLGPVAARELRDRCGQEFSRVQTHRVRDYDVLSFSFPPPIDALFCLGTVEDLFYQLAIVPLAGGPADLEQLQSLCQSAPLEPGLRLHRQQHSHQGRRRTSFRVVVQARDGYYAR